MVLHGVSTLLDNCHQTFHTCAAQHMLQHHLVILQLVVHHLVIPQLVVHTLKEASPSPLKSAESIFNWHSSPALSVIVLANFTRTCFVCNCTCEFHAYYWHFLDKASSAMAMLGKQDHPGVPKVPVPQKSSVSNQGEAYHSSLCDKGTSSQILGHRAPFQVNQYMHPGTVLCGPQQLALILNNSPCRCNNRKHSLWDADTYMCPINSPGNLRKSPACLKHGHNVPKPLTRRKRHIARKEIF